MSHSLWLIRHPCNVRHLCIFYLRSKMAKMAARLPPSCLYSNQQSHYDCYTTGQNPVTKTYQAAREAGKYSFCSTLEAMQKSLPQLAFFKVRLSEFCEFRIMKCLQEQILYIKFNCPVAKNIPILQKIKLRLDKLNDLPQHIAK